MSNPAPDASLSHLERWKTAREKKIEEAERDREANRIHDLWKELWTDHIVEPLRALAPRWVLAWDELGKVSISGDRQKTAEAMLKIATLANEIGTVWPLYAAAYVKWYREHGTAWNARVSRDRGHFLDRPIPLPRPPDVDPLRWQWAYPVWAIDPVAMLERFAENIARASGYESIRRLDVVDDLRLLLAILIGLARNDLTNEDAAEIVTFAIPDSIAASGLALAAAALPTPEVVDQLQNAIQSDALGMAKWVLKSIGPDEYKGTIQVALASLVEVDRGERRPAVARLNQKRTEGREDQQPADPNVKRAKSNDKPKRNTHLADPVRSTRAREILTALVKAKAPMTADEIATAIGASSQQVRNHAAAMVKKGLIRKPEGGGYEILPAGKKSLEESLGPVARRRTM